VQLPVRATVQPPLWSIQTILDKLAVLLTISDNMN
jgi:hypothetical protein